MKTLVRLLCCISLLILAPLRVDAVGTLISAPNRTDMVYDAGRDILYITSSNSTVLRYQLASDSFLPPFVLSGSLMGLDLSPDGNKLVIADAKTTNSLVWVHVVDLTTGQDTLTAFNAAANESGTFAVAFAGDGAAYITSRFAGSGWVPMRRYDPVTGIASVTANPRQDSMVSSSGDGSTVVIAEGNISSGPVDQYDVTLHAFLHGTGHNQFNFECSVSRDGALVAVPTYGSTYIYNGTLNLVTNIGVGAGAQPVGAAFHPFADAIFCPMATTPYVNVYNTTNWQLIAQFDFQNTFTALPTVPHAFVQGRTRLSPDGSILFVTVSGGIRYYRHGLSLPLMHRLVVAGNPGAIGTPTPVGYGTSWLAEGTNLTIQVPVLVETNGIRYLCPGWTGTGSVPASGATTSATFTLTNNSVLTWNWSTNQYQLAVAVSGSGTVSVSNAWYSPGAIATLTAIPGSNYYFVRWLGNVPVCAAANPTLALTMDRPRGLTALFAPIGSAAASLAGDWPTFGNGPAHTGYFPGGLGNEAFSSNWVAAIPGFTQPLQQVAISGGRIFVTPRLIFANGYLAALYETNGQPAWTYNFALAFSINPPTCDSGNVFVQRCYPSSTALWSFNATNGAINWTAPHNAQGENYLAPTVVSGRVWVEGGQNGGMYGFNETNGTQLFFTKLEQIDAWDPTYYNGRVYTCVAGNFREHEPQTGALLWSTNMTWSWSGFDMYRTVAAANGMAYFSGSSGMFAVDLSSRTVAWQVTNTFTGTPAVANDVVYAMAGSSVLAYSRTGQYLGSYTADSALAGQPIVTDDVLIAASSSTTYVFDLCTGNLRQTLPVGGNLSLANGVLYVASATGQLYAYPAAPPFKITCSLLNQGGGTQFVLWWPGVAGKSYNVWFTSNLSSPFTVIASNLAATPPVNSFPTTVGPTTTGFYRIDAH